MRVGFMVVMVGATIAVAGGQATAATVTVQIENFDGPYVDIGLNMGDDGIDVAANHQWRAAGFGTPNYFESMIGNLPPGVPNEGTDAQNYEIARSDLGGNPYPNDGAGWLVNQMWWYNPTKAKWEWTWDKIDWVAFVQAKGGPEPDLTQPAVFTCDCMISVDNLDHFFQLETTFDLVFSEAGKTVTRFSAKDQFGNLNPAFVNTTWFNDVVLVEFTQFPVVPSAPAFFFDFNWETVADPVKSGATWSIDDLKITYTPVATSSCNTPPQDADDDGDVDLTDFGAFQACFNGPNRAYSGPPENQARCACMDLDPDDGDVDLTDFGAFQTCFNGPNRPPNC